MVSLDRVKLARTAAWSKYLGALLAEENGLDAQWAYIASLDRAAHVARGRRTGDRIIARRPAF
jgi:hypothetical protein